LTGPFRSVYHSILKVVLRLVGLDFSWYLNFYRKWPHALPAVEVCLQRLRPVRTSKRYFSRYSIEKFAQRGDTVLDIGANIGEVSSHLLTLGYHVHAYEPDPRCAEFLRRRFSRVDRGRFHLHEKAVSDYDGVANLYFGSLTTESSSILRNKPGTVMDDGHHVEVCSIDGVLDSVGYAALIMMDIEGAEYSVLDQMLKPENRDKFGLCVAESHANKIPELELQHRRILETIEQSDLQERVLLDWH
jgi:FkbM family methyltransferase